MKYVVHDQVVFSRPPEGPVAPYNRKVASRVCPSLQQKRVTVHCLRHTMAMDLLQAGVRRSVIALWLGHESVETTQAYLEATLAMKEQALAKTSPLCGKPRRYRPADQLLDFLNRL
jgi:integrase